MRLSLIWILFVCVSLACVYNVQEFIIFFVIPWQIFIQIEKFLIHIVLKVPLKCFEWDQCVQYLSTCVYEKKIFSPIAGTSCNGTEIFFSFGYIPKYRDFIKLIRSSIFSYRYKWKNVIHYFFLLTITRSGRPAEIRWSIFTWNYVFVWNTYTCIVQLAGAA